MHSPIIREEEERDRQAVREINELAFGQTNEADLVEALHGQGAVAAASVAELDGGIVGHILFSAVEIERHAGKRLVGLAPMAVAPRFQRHGVGSLLIRNGLVRCIAFGFDGVLVVGHADYYPRFGFLPARQFGLQCEYDVPSEVFMALELPGRSLAGVSGLVRYHPAFANA